MLKKVASRYNNILSFARICIYFKHRLFKLFSGVKMKKLFLLLVIMSVIGATDFAADGIYWDMTTVDNLHGHPAVAFR